MYHAVFEPGGHRPWRRSTILTTGSGGKTLIETSATDPGDADVSRGDIFDLLRNRRRRAVLDYLRRNEGESTLDELAKHVAADEYDTSIEKLSAQQRKRVYVSLYQNHLPRIDEVGLVEYDKDEGTVAPLDLSRVSRYLPPETDADEDVPSHFYVALAVAAIVTVGLSGIGPTSAVPSTVWALVSTAALVIVAAVEIHRWNGRTT